MKSKLRIFILCLAPLLIVACDKAPKGIIKESDLADFLYDMYRLDAIIDQHPDEFSTDSIKRVAKQSLFLKHGITQAEYDTSMVWYATNFEAYSTVHKKVIMRLQDESKALAAEAATAPKERQQQDGSGQRHKYYATKGDTADIWNDVRTLMLTSGFKRGYFTFNIEPDLERHNGDRYALGMKMLTFGNAFKLMLAVEYMDGSVSLTSRGASINGWTELALQSDSTRIVRRIFGYVNIGITSPSTVTFLDSISLVRTHLDRKIYSNIGAQKYISRGHSPTRARQGAGAPKRQGGPDRVQPATPQRLYAPKPGVNKGGVEHGKFAPPMRRYPRGAKLVQ